MELRAIEPEVPEFTPYLTLTWGWTQERPEFFPYTGGKDSLRDYLAKMQRGNVKAIGVFVDGKFICLITVVQEEKGYCIHITSPRKSCSEVITQAVYAVGYDLFDKLSAQSVYTASPTYKSKRRHHGSHRLVKACGLTPTGHKETDEYGNLWTYYELTRDNWLKYHYGQAEDGTEADSAAESDKQSAAVWPATAGAVSAI